MKVGRNTLGALLGTAMGDRQKGCRFYDASTS